MSASARRELRALLRGAVIAGLWLASAPWWPELHQVAPFRGWA